MANNYYERGDRLNVYLAAELPEEMTGQQDTWHICGKCAWYNTSRKQECICGKTGKEVAFFATKKCFTTEKDTTMEENTNAQPVAETGTQVCKACRAEKIRVSMATGKEKKGTPADEPVVILKTADFSDAALLEELRRRGYKGKLAKVQEVEI